MRTHVCIRARVQQEVLLVVLVFMRRVDLCDPAQVPRVKLHARVEALECESHHESLLTGIEAVIVCERVLVSVGIDARIVALHQILQLRDGEQKDHVDDCKAQ